MKHKTTKRGFTLLELAVVMAVVGMLVGGLFELVTSGTRTVNNQITAQQLQLLDKTTKAWLLATRSTTTVGGDTLDGTLYAIGDSHDVTANVQAYRQNTLPALAPNGGNYQIVVARGNDVASQAYYQILITINGGVAHSLTDIGQIASYAGGEGAGVYPANAGASSVAGCTVTGPTVRGSFGGICVNLPVFTVGAGGVAIGIETTRPAVLAFMSMADLGTSDDHFLWRTQEPLGSGLNSMTVDLGIQGNHSITFAGAGNLAMNGGSINGPTNLTMSGAISGPTGLTMANSGGSIDTKGGNINLQSSGRLQNAVNIGVNDGTNSANINFIDLTIDATTTENVLQFTGINLWVPGTLYSNSLKAKTFVYASSFATSDERLKTDIKPLENSLDMLLKIRGVSYRLKEDGKKSMGVIAQDVERVYPELVQDVSPNHKAVNYNGLIGPLIESIRVLKEQNDRLTARVEALESQMQQKGDN